jgi:hypothetical protein
MSIQEISAEHLAELLHHYHQSLAPDFEKQAEAEAQSWKRVSQEERNRMIAAAKLALLELDQLDKERENSKRCFAKPGEAEWGC